MSLRRLYPVAIALSALAGCGDRSVPDERSASTVPVRAETAAIAFATPVRVGEAGAAFDACQAAGTPRNIDAAGALPVRAAPFDTAASTGSIMGGARFFVCARSIDQRWMGIVFEPGGTLAPGCGVSAPVPRRAVYAGPCASGWVSSAAVRLVAG